MGNGVPFKELSNLSNEVFKNIFCRQVAFFKCVRLCSLLSLNLNVESFVLLLALAHCALKGLWTALSRFLLPGQPKEAGPPFHMVQFQLSVLLGKKKARKGLLSQGSAFRLSCKVSKDDSESPHPSGDSHDDLFMGKGFSQEVDSPILLPESQALWCSCQGKITTKTRERSQKG